jgi:hypothetical protein
MSCSSGVLAEMAPPVADALNSKRIVLIEVIKAAGVERQSNSALRPK